MTDQKGQFPTKAQADSARVRQRRRATKPPGLITRERELAVARRELTVIRGSRVATKQQIKHAKSVIKRAELSLERQRDAARRSGRSTGG